MTLNLRCTPLIFSTGRKNPPRLQESFGRTCALAPPRIPFPFVTTQFFDGAGRSYIALGNEKGESVQKENSKLVIRPSESGGLITQLGIRVGVRDAPN